MPATRPPACLLVDADRISQALDPTALRHAVADAFRAAAAGGPAPATIGMEVPDGTFHVKASLGGTAGGPRYFVAKINGNIPPNPARNGLPTIQGLLVLCDARTGSPLAVMDSAAITILRTAAATAVAAELLSRPDAGHLAIIGCGVQAVAHLDALRQVRPIRAVSLYDVSSAAAGAFAAHVTAAGLDVHCTTSVHEAASGADIVVTLTPSKSPILGAGDVRAGAFVAAVGSDNPHKSEIAPELMAASAVICDRTTQCATMGDLHHAIDAGRLAATDVRAELADVLADPSRGRRSPDEVVLFDSTGLAFQDVAAATLVIERLRDDPAAPRFPFAA